MFSGHEEVLTLTGDIGKDEVNEGVRKLLSGKALGEDEICLKGPETSVCFGAFLADMCQQQEGGFSVDQLKKGDWNHRGSHLLVSLGKSIQGYWRRIKLIVKPWIQAEQYDFCPGCGTLVQLHSFFYIHLLR